MIITKNSPIDDIFLRRNLKIGDQVRFTYYNDRKIEGTITDITVSVAFPQDKHCLDTFLWINGGVFVASYIKEDFQLIKEDMKPIN